jgi:predicted O-methyltransferase YrrM
LRARVTALALSRQPWATWFAGKDFTTDWVTNRAPVWAQILTPMRQEKLEVLEVGSFEGRSTIFWLEYLPESVVTCIDTFQGTTRYHDDVEGRFDRNTVAYGSRARKIKSASAAALAGLLAEGARFDLTYIDGSHFRDDVMVDCLLAWGMLRASGVMILDDYELDSHKKSAERPHDAIDTFLGWRAGEIDVLHRGNQIIIRRAT